MGMDVSGIKPTSEKGIYFRANVWSWRPIHSLMAMANARNKYMLMTQEQWESMDHNDGAGLQTQKECNDLADALESILKNNKELREFGFIVSAKEDEIKIRFPLTGDDDEMAIDIRNGSFVSNTKTIPTEYKTSPYSVSLSHAKEFVVFLRECGGFSVY